MNPIMDQVRDVRKMLIELRSDIQKIIAPNTHRRERRELKTRVVMTLGQIRTSSNLPEEMQSAHQTYYLKTDMGKMEDTEYKELIDKTSIWETEVTELSKISTRLIDAMGGEFLLPRETLIIGRATGYEAVQLEDRFVSRVHACLIYDGKSHQFFVLDLNSMNGTFLNGRKIKHSLLRSGDEIVMGRTFMGVDINQKLRILDTTGLARALEGHLMVLGRSLSSKILVCNDPHVSRLHAIIMHDPENNSYRIRDLNSSNKTFVNKHRLTTELALRNGDVVSVARTKEFTFISA